jgi:hypothetical protein
MRSESFISLLFLMKVKSGCKDSKTFHSYRNMIKIFFFRLPFGRKIMGKGAAGVVVISTGAKRSGEIPSSTLRGLGGDSSTRPLRGLGRNDGGD